MSDNGALKILPEVEIQEEVSSPDKELLQKVSEQLAALGELKGLEDKLAVLWKLDKLDRLAYLAELQRLDKLAGLDHLEQMEKLNKLDNLKYLSELKGLKSLSGLSNLDKLNHLIRLKYLNKLEELQALDHLKELDKLNLLKELDKLSGLQRLEGLKKLDKLEILNKLEDLRHLMIDHADDFQKFEHLRHIEKLDNLKKLEALDNLDNLSALDSLESLDKLKDLKDLSKLEKLNKLHELSSLDKLENLSGLERLNKLDELRHLEKLENMQDLGKLDYLKDAKVQTALKGLEKLAFFEESHKKFALKLVFSLLVDTFKIAAIASLMFFVFTKNISRQTFDRLVPYLGFGEADRVNVALSILAQDLSSRDFDTHFKNLESRVKREASSVFDGEVHKNMDHYRMLENLTSYNFHHESYDLMAFAKKELNEWAAKSQKKFNDSYTYDVEHVSSRTDLEQDLDYFRKGSIFLKQQKYLEAYVEMSRIKNKRDFSSLGHGLSYAFYMAFRTKPADLKIYLEK